MLVKVLENNSAGAPAGIVDASVNLNSCSWPAAIYLDHYGQTWMMNQEDYEPLHVVPANIVTDDYQQAPCSFT